MTQEVDVPGVGTLEFPDGMSQPAMAAAIQKNFPNLGKTAAPPSYDDRVSQAGAAFDQAAGSGLGGLARTAGAAGEDALSMFSGLGGDLAGALTSVLTQNAAKGNAVRNAVTYQPRTQAGKAGLNYLGALASPLTGLMNMPIQALQNSGHPILAQTARAAEDVAPFALPELRGAKLSAEVQQATDAGLRLTPQQAGGALGRMVQSLAGSAKLERALSLKNAPVVNKLAAEAIGTPDLSDAAIDAAKGQANAVYDQAATSGTVALKPSDFSSVKTAGTLKHADVQALQDHFSNMGTIDANDLIADMRQLRAEGPKNIRAPNAPAQNALGWAQKAAADGLEKALDRHLQGLGAQSPIDIADFRNARQQLAKIHSVQDAMEGPNVSARALNKQLDRGVPLSGNLRTIANAYGNFDRSLQDVSKIRDSGPFGALDTSLLGLAGRAHPGVLAATIAKPFARSALASKAYQHFGIGGHALLPPSAGTLGRLSLLPALQSAQPRGLLP